MDSLINSAARALAAGDIFGALNRVALRDDPPALAMRGIAMAQLGDLDRARDLLRRAERAFGTGEPVARARCVVALAEIALALRDIGAAMRRLGGARRTLERNGDYANAAHAGYLEARRLLLIGRLDEAEALLDALNMDVLPPASRAGAWLVAAGIAMRRIRSAPAEAALALATDAARVAAIPALVAEVEDAARAFAAPTARLIARDGERTLGLAEVEALIASETLLIDACRSRLCMGARTVSLAGRPVLFALLQTLAQAWPEDVPREVLLAHAFRARHADESHRARLRVEIGRLRAEIEGVARITATEDGFVLEASEDRPVTLIAAPRDDAHGFLLALLADGEAWSSSALALALDVSPRTVQRGLEALAAAGKVDSFGRGRACRWIVKQIPGFPTALLLPVVSMTR